MSKQIKWQRMSILCVKKGKDFWSLWHFYHFELRVWPNIIVNFVTLVISKEMILLSSHFARIGELSDNDIKQTLTLLTFYEVLLKKAGFYPSKRFLTECTKQFGTFEILIHSSHVILRNCMALLYFIYELGVNLGIFKMKISIDIAG